MQILKIQKPRDANDSLIGTAWPAVADEAALAQFAPDACIALLEI